MRPLLALAIVLCLAFVAVPVSANAAVSSDDGRCLPEFPCETVNNLCRKVLKTDCLALEEPSCINCDAVNRVCQKLFDTNCLG